MRRPFILACALGLMACPRPQEPKDPNDPGPADGETGSQHQTEPDKQPDKQPATEPEKDTDK